ncbi:MAG: hypothetical protein KJP00_00445 [Bacteroidia bacterium]|nr:hypothetical protein [Bacteroidia bacterium]
MKRKYLLPLALLVVVMCILGFVILPIGHAPAKDYFAPIGERTLQTDEIGQFNYIFEQFEHMSFMGDEFKGWDTDEQPFWRYGIAFGAYSMPSIAMISPEHADRAKLCLSHMIDKMKSKKVWGDWIEYGMGDDPISEGNIMYKGHLNLMYGLYQLITGSESYSKEYTWLTNKIVDEMRKHHAEGKHEGADCEPGRYFAQCNSISLLSLMVYDQLYGTEYSDVEARWTVDFIKNRMTDEHYGFYLKMYSSKNAFCNPMLSGYTNAWTMAFLRPFEPDYNETLYDVWKEHFTKEIGPYAYVKEDPEAGPSPLATMTGMMAAKEFGDIDLWRKLRNSVDRDIYQKNDRYHYLYKNVNNAIYNGPLLWTKVHVGWQKILSHDWGDRESFEIPDVNNMEWTDILSQELLLMDDVLN